MEIQEEHSMIYMNKHILWIFEVKWPQCELCHDMPTSKAAMSKYISLYMACKIN